MSSPNVPCSQPINSKPESPQSPSIRIEPHSPHSPIIKADPDEPQSQTQHQPSPEPVQNTKMTEEHSDTDSAPRTPPPETITPWTEGEATELRRFLSTALGPLTITDVAEHMGRSVFDTTAMVISLWQSALHVARERESRVGWWVGRPLSNHIGLGRSVVFTVESNITVLVFYDTGSLEGTRMPIEWPGQMYEDMQLSG